MLSGSGTAFTDIETGNLRAVYRLAVCALGYTHYVDKALMDRLAEAVFEAYVCSNCPALPLSTVEVEDMTVLGIELLTHSHPELLISKH